MIASIRHPRRIASSTEESVSLVSPENDDAITSVCGPAYSGSAGVRFTSTGTESRSRKVWRKMSPATAEPPIPQNTTDVTPSSAGRPVVASPDA